MPKINKQKKWLIVICILLTSSSFAGFGQKFNTNSEKNTDQLEQEINILLSSGADDSARILVNILLSGSKKQNNIKGLANVDYYEGIFAINQGKFNIALERLISARQQFKSIDSQSGIIKCEFQIGIIQYMLKNYEKAWESFGTILKSNQDFSRKSKVEYLSGLCLTKLNRVEEAEQLLLKALDFYKKNNAFKNIAESQVALSELFIKQGRLEQAEAFIEKALTWFNINSEDNGKSICYLRMGEIEWLRGNIEYATALTKKSFIISDSIQFFNVKERASFQLSELYLIQENYKGSYEYLKLHYQTRDSIMTTDNLSAISMMESELKLTKNQAELVILQKQSQVDRILIYSVILGIVFLLIISIFIFKMYRNERIAKDLVHLEKIRSDELLLNILPKETSEELKLYGKAKARRFEKATVLFADIKGFTLIAEKISPEKVVHMIDQYFCAFDMICEKNQVEKIKTIGDAYLCVGGLPNPEHGSPEDVVRVACEMQQAVSEINETNRLEGEPSFEIRIGIHTGSVVAGVVGKKKFAYDIWGDTVNTAARMEQSSLPGKINISGATYEEVKDKFNLIYRGKVAAKNKGEIDMYFVENIFNI